jgi:hypothetical protein
MLKPTASFSLAGSCLERSLQLHCPTLEARAEITVARWKATDGQYTPWCVVDCSLLPAGQIACRMRCLAHLPDVLE